MRYLRVFCRGDRQTEEPQSTAFWMVHIREDGEVWGEIMANGQARFLPDDFRLADTGRFFEIPPDLRRRQIVIQPNPQEVLITLKETSGQVVSSFLDWQVQQRGALRSALDELLQKMQAIIVTDDLQPAACELVGD
jgi:hypothetical protein